MQRRAVLGTALCTLVACGDRDDRNGASGAPVTSEGPGGSTSTSMSADSASRRDLTLVRVINAASSGGELTVRADESRSLPPVGYKNVSPYVPIDENWTRFEVRGGSGAFEPLATNREVMRDGQRYSIVVMRTQDGTGFDTRVVRDDPGTDSTRAHVRVIHAAPGVGDVTIRTANGQELFDDIGFSDEAGYKDVAPVSGALEVVTSDRPQRVTRVSDLSLTAGRSYTIVLTRTADGKIEAFHVEDVRAGL
ncbi:MAG: DUF4397 domain-containing protein [Gemmatimonadaceae bacterium]|nr:DUF4397 domain-containing protein [Gemmatimonadaceae bacterium]